MFLVKVSRELAKNRSGDSDVIVEPGFGRQKVVEKFFLVHVLVKIDRLFDQIAHGTKQQQRGLEKIRRAIAKGINKFVHVEIFPPRPNIEQAIGGAEINRRS